MSIAFTSTVLAATTVAVAPTETVLLSQQLFRGASRLVVQVVNLDASQTFSGSVYRRREDIATWALSSIADLASIAPLGSVMVDLDVIGTDRLEIRGTMSGAGGNVSVGALVRAVSAW